MADVTKKENLQQHLKKSTDKDLYLHVSKVMSHVVKHCPHKAIDDIEEISYLLKHQGKGKKLDMSEYMMTSITKQYAQPADEFCAKGTNEIIERAQPLFKKAEVKLDDEGKEVDEPLAPIGNMPDLVKEAQIWESAGVSFGEYELMLLIRSMKKLATTSQASQLRLWGKIRGTKKDYFIAEGSLPAAEEGEGGGPEIEGMEPRGAGINKNVYWATNNPLLDWTLLPDLKPQDIKNARTIKYMFSGDIDAKIYTNPFFFETEKTYLRAQIARISQSTTLVPKGVYKFQEETEEREIVENVAEDEGAEVPKPPAEQMLKLENWVHFIPSILNQGRLTHMDAKAPEGEGAEEVDPEELKKREIAKDPWQPRLKPILKDNKTKGELPAWIVRSQNCGHKYLDAKTQQCKLSYGVVVVKSMWWPGSFTFYHQEKTLQIYVGDGMKHESQTYYPVHPPMMQMDKKEISCADEPNPTKEWLDKKAKLEEQSKNVPPPEE